MSISTFRAVYKIVNEQEIAVDIYLPAFDNIASKRCPILINIHGGAFMLGSSKTVNHDQIQDCLNRGWVVLAPNHRLCPQVNLLDGPIQDCRDLLAWIHNGSLKDSICNAENWPHELDLDHVFAFGTSSGGTLALCLGFDVPRPVTGIHDMYGAVNFSDEFWTTPLPHISPPNLPDSFLNRIFDENPVPIVGGVSLEGQAPGPPDFSDPRQAFALTRIARGEVMQAVFPSSAWEKVDPMRNVTGTFPPTFIVHEDADIMIPVILSRELFGVLREKGVKCGMREVPGEDHTFAARMEVSSTTWEFQREGFDFLEGLIA